MNGMRKRCLNMFLLTLCAITSLVLFSSDAFAVGAASKGRTIWDNIMLWINFGILVFFFIKFGKRPLMNFLRGERQTIKDGIDAVEEKVKKARTLMEARADKLKNIDKRIKKVRQGIIELGQKERERIIEKAKITASKMIEDSKKEAQYKLEMAKKRFSEEMLDMAVSIAVEGLKKEISQDDNERIVDQFASGLNTTGERLE